MSERPSEIYLRLRTAFEQISNGEFRVERRYMEELYLKSCPFCGSSALLKSSGFGVGTYYVTCGNPECEVSPSTSYYNTEKEAADVWNHREPSLEKLRKMKEFLSEKRGKEDD